MSLQVLALHVNHHTLDDIDHKIRLLCVQFEIIAFQIRQKTLALSYIVSGNDLSCDHIFRVADCRLLI